LVKAKKYAENLVKNYAVCLHTTAGMNGILKASQQQWIIQNINSVTVSLDGSPAIQNRQRPFPDGSPSFQYVDRSLRAFDAAGYPYSIRTTVTAESVRSLVQIVTFFCENYSCRKIKLEPMYPRGRAADLKLNPPDAVEFIEYFRQARQIAEKTGCELLYSGARLNVLTSVFCQAAGCSCAVTPEGKITSCYEVITDSDPLADMFIYGYFDPLQNRLVADEKSRERLFNLNVAID